MSSASGDGHGEPHARTQAASDPDGARRPLVSCLDCGSAWYGETTAHGLSILGHCSRCGGTLRFADIDGGGVPQEAEGSVTGDRREPWQVLGRPGR